MFGVLFGVWTCSASSFFFFLKKWNPANVSSDFTMEVHIQVHSELLWMYRWLTHILKAVALSCFIWCQISYYKFRESRVQYLLEVPWDWYILKVSQLGNLFPIQTCCYYKIRSFYVIISYHKIRYYENLKLITLLPLWPYLVNFNEKAVTLFGLYMSDESLVH